MITGDHASLVLAWCNTSATVQRDQPAVLDASFDQLVRCCCIYAFTMLDTLFKWGQMKTCPFVRSS